MAGESLRVTAGNAVGTEISLDEELVIGRSATGDGRLGDDPELSRRHARIVQRAGDQLVIEDLGSTNGTFVNGRRIEDVQTLRAGDTIEVGTTTLRVLDASGNAPQATAFAAVPPPAEQATAFGRGAGVVDTPARPQPAAPVPPAASGRKSPSVALIAGLALLLVVAVVLILVLM